MVTSAATRLVLCILDGFGHRAGPEGTAGDARTLANTPFIDSLFERYPHTTLACSGLAVGLPKGQMGNSEVGHLTIGAGRVVNQELVRIRESVESGDFATRSEWLELVATVKAGSGRLHLPGLVSPGGVHSHTDHLYGIVAAARDAGIDDICIHALLDGRDTDPRSGLGYVRELQTKLDELGTGRIVLVSGRYYAMDRDKRWDRVEKAWRAMVHGEGVTAANAIAAIEASYAAGVTDEFVLPTVITDEDGSPLATVGDGDGFFFWNFRADRARELTWAFNIEDFEGFERPVRPKIAYLCMTPYDEKLDVPALYRPEHPRNGLADVLAKAGLRNLRTAETEKYAHVTYFLNGGIEEPFEGEERILIPSPRVATYDLQPEMSAPAVAGTIFEQAASGNFDVIIANFANGDMVGHTGILEAAIAAVETLDAALAKVLPPIVAAGGTFLVTADHGNCEEMLTPEGKPMTAHSLNEVPFLVASKATENAGDYFRDGPRGLADIAPTMLDLLKLAQPAEMTGRSLMAGDIQ